MRLDIVVLVCISGHAAFGFMFDDPCSVSPHFGPIPDDPDTTYTVDVPPGCRNGTFRWDYPKGHVMLRFNNSNDAVTAICVRDWLGGDVFVITDLTGTDTILGALYGPGVTSCTAKTTVNPIILQVDAPQELRYMGEFAYFVEH